MDININIKRKSIKNSYLRVKENGEVTLTVPLRATDDYIRELLEKKQRWIEKSLQKMKGKQDDDVPKAYISGDIFHYLGESYSLKVIASHEEKVVLDADQMLLYTLLPNKKEYKEKQISRWYQDRAYTIFHELLEVFQKIVAQEVNKVCIRKMKTRWGSCNYLKKNITLNLRLIEKPLACIEYVVLHELSHLIYPNHSKDFYNYVSLLMPDYKLRKQRLEGRNF